MSINYQNLKPWENEEDRFIAILLSSIGVNQLDLTALEMRDLAIDFFNYLHNTPEICNIVKS